MGDDGVTISGDLMGEETCLRPRTHCTLHSGQHTLHTSRQQKRRAEENLRGYHHHHHHHHPLCMPTCGEVRLPEQPLHADVQLPLQGP